MRYRDAGVDLSRADAIKQRIALAVRTTWGAGVRPLERGFAGVMECPAGARLRAASMDGVGTKLHLALADGRVADAAADLVYHGANDLLVHGARPPATPSHRRSHARGDARRHPTWRARRARSVA